MNLKSKILFFVSLILCSFWTTAQTTTCDDYSSTAGWTQISTGTSVTSGVVSYSNCPGALSRRIWKNHGVALSNNWKLNTEFIFTQVGVGGPGHIVAGLTNGSLDPISAANGTPWTPTNQDAILLTFGSTNNTNDPTTFRLQVYTKDQSTLSAPSTGIHLIASKLYYITLERFDDLNGRLTVYSDAQRTIVVGTECYTILPKVTNDLFVLQHGVVSWANSNRNMTARVDNTCITNNAISAGTISQNQTVCNGTAANPFQSIAPATGIPNVTYQWEISLGCTGVWSTIPGATAATYSAGIVTQTACYRRVANGPCNSKFYSNEVAIKVIDCNTLPCQFSDNYSTNLGWTYDPIVPNGTNITSNAVQYFNCFGGNTSRIYRNHGVAMTNSWRLDLDFTYDGSIYSNNNSSGGPGHILAALTAGTVDPISSTNGIPTWAASNQDAIMVAYSSFNHTQNSNSFVLQPFTKDGTTLVTPGNVGITLNSNTMYYITLERLDQTHGRLSVYSNPARTALVNSMCFSISAGIVSNLNVIQHGVISWAGDDRDLRGSVDNVCLANTLFDGGTIKKDQKIPCGSVPLSLLNVSLASGPNNTFNFTYQWQQSVGCNGIWSNIAGATGISYSPQVLNQSTCYRRVAYGPCGLELYSNTVQITVTLGLALDAGFTASTSCPAGASTFTVSTVSNTTTGNNFTWTWTITEVDANNVPCCSAPVSLATWANAGTNFPGYTFLQGHYYRITRTVQDQCTEVGTISVRVSCGAGIAPQGGGSGTTRAANAAMSIFPNPSNGDFQISNNLKADDQGAYVIYDFSGKIITKGDLDQKMSKQSIVINEAQGGVYYCDFIVNGQKISTEKIVIVK